MSDLIDFPSLCDLGRLGNQDASLADLIERCLRDEKPAWNEFFLRFTGLTINAIRNTLNYYGADRPDRVRTVWEGLSEHILAKRAFLGRLRSPDALPSVLEEMSVNFTITFLRKQSTRKGVIKGLEDGATISIEASATLQGDPRVAELIDWEPELLIDEEVDIRAFFSSPMSEEDYLLMKIRCLFYQPLMGKDIEAIAASRKTSPDAIWAEVDRLMNVLLIREEKRVKAQNQAGIERMLLWRRRVQLEKLRENALLNAARIKAVEKDIEKLSKKVEQQREKVNTMIFPKNKEIAAILGVPLKSVGNINTRLHRVRKKLAESLEGKRRRGEVSY